MAFLVTPRDQIRTANTRIKRAIDHIRHHFSSSQREQDSTAREWVYECSCIADRDDSLHILLSTKAERPRPEPRVDDHSAAQSTSGNRIAEHREFEQALAITLRLPQRLLCGQEAKTTATAGTVRFDLADSTIPVMKEV